MAWLSLPLDIGAALFVLALFVLKRQIVDRAKLPLPPGPKRWPLIGTVLSMPMEYEWLTYTRWTKLYGTLQLDLEDTILIIRLGSVFYLNACGVNIVVLNSYKAACDCM